MAHGNVCYLGFLHSESPSGYRWILQIPETKVCVVHFARIKAFQVKRATEQVSYRHAEQCR